MLTQHQRDTIFTTIRSGEKTWQFDNTVGRALGMPATSLKRALDGDEQFEYQARTSRAGKAYQVVRLRLTRQNLLKLLPIPLGTLESDYYGEREQLAQLLREANQAGELHVEGNMLCSGPGAAPDAGSRAPRPPRSTGESVTLDPDSLPPLRDEDMSVLGALEDVEQNRINFGLYETYTTLEEIRSRSGQGEVAIRDSLRRLERHRWVMQPTQGRYRSRISEIVRLVKNVKQRFSENDADTAPYLVQSVQVHFADRRRLRRLPAGSFEAAFEAVYQENRSEQRRRLRAVVDVTKTGLAGALGQTPGSAGVTAVQERALKSIAQAYLERTGSAFVITGNTGSGKTEAALMPLLLGALEERVTADRLGTKVVLVYPRQNLAKNQLERVCKYVAHLNRELSQRPLLSRNALSVGIVFGETPETDAELTGQQSQYGRHWAEDGDARVLPYFAASDGGAVRATGLQRGECTVTSGGGFEQGGWELSEFRATREAIRNNPPDVLIITTEMLHRWLMDPRYGQVFGLSPSFKSAPAFAPPRAVVFDEIHLYNGIHGAQIGMLLRRVQHRLKRAMYRYSQFDQQDGWKYPLMLGMSATIGHPKSFWERLSGSRHVSELSPAPEDLEAAQGREYFLFIRPETYSRGRNVGDASAAIQTIMTISHNMRRRGGANNENPKHRSLVFQDSISKLKKLTVEFRDAESRLFLSQFRLKDAPEDTNELLGSGRFLDGEYWYFDARDPYQYSQGRTNPGDPPVALSSDAKPVYSGGGPSADKLGRDIIFATTSLEVGYDDPSIQFVLQHHAPGNTASFVQKKGRAGRSLDDRPITAVTLSQNSFRDAFYYQNPSQLYDPSDYTPPLNAENYFVQRFQAIALLFDELARLTGQNLARRRDATVTLEEHLEQVEAALAREGWQRDLTWAYEDVISESFRRQPGHGSWRELWQWFRERLLDPEVRQQYRRARDLLELCPDFPRQLFSSINLPTINVMYPEGKSGEFEFTQEDVALAFSEFAPGRVTRRYGRGHQLYWRPPMVKLGSEVVQNRVALERYKERDGNPGPFDARKLQDLAGVWGEGYAERLPKAVQRLYGRDVPRRFYRVRYLELWTFGTLNPYNPKGAGEDWHWWGRKQGDGSVHVRYNSRDEQGMLRAGYRRVAPESNSYPLKFSVVKPGQEQDPPRTALVLPPLFAGLLDRFDSYWGEIEGRKNQLHVWEAQYGAEAHLLLIRRDQHDDQAGYGHNLVQYVSEADGEPVVYGYDLQTEGLRVPYDRATLEDLSKRLFDRLWASEDHRAHVQDQYLRYLLKSEPWAEGVEEGLNPYDQRRVAELLSTMRAESRAEQVGSGEFLELTATPEGFERLLGYAGRYWRDHRVLNEDFVGRARRTFADPGVRERLSRLMSAVRREPAVLEYLRDTLIHSLEHATHNLFLIAGSTSDHEVGSSAQLSLTHQSAPSDHAFYVYERNQDGAGATRAATAQWEDATIERRVKDWWNTTMACAVGDEESFVKAMLRRHGDTLQAEADRLLDLPPGERDERALRALLQELSEGMLQAEHALLGRLAGLLTSELRVLGVTLRRAQLQRELLALEDDLARRFMRPALPGEVAGHALTRLEAGAELPALKQLLGVYRAHFGTSGPVDEQEEAEDQDANAHDRFLAQLEHLSLSTCVDACPACLASHCDQGHIDVMRHTLSRRLLKFAHEELTRDFTLRAEHATPRQLADVAREHGGYVVLEYTGTLPDALVRGWKGHDLQSKGRVFDHDRLLLRQVLHLSEEA